MTKQRIVIALEGETERELLRVALADDLTEVVVCSGRRDLEACVGGEERLSAIVMEDSLRDGAACPLFRRIRERTDGPLMVLGDGKTEPIAAYEHGADDVISAPIDPVVLLARVKAHFRRFRTRSLEAEHDPATLCFDDLELDMVRRELRRSGVGQIGLSSTEFELMRVFATRPNTPLSREMLIAALRGRPLSGYDRAVDMQVRRLRQKIERDPGNPHLIKTIRGLGYLLAARVVHRADTAA